MKLISGATTPEVWLLAAEHLNSLRPRQDFDVFLHVETPTVLTTGDTEVQRLVDRFLTAGGGFNTHTVAETIFPLSYYLRGGASAVFDDYPRRMKEIRSVRSDRSWGCYALRLIERKDRDGQVYRPLAALIEKMKKHGKYTAGYEAGIGTPDDDLLPSEEELAVYDGAADRRMLYGGPCLSHLSFKVHKGAVRLNATYRSHFYVQRLLGNLIGLAALQFFVAREANLTMGPLTINSTFAKLDKGSDNGAKWSHQQIDDLLAACRSVYSQLKAA
jgi:hypothetical protein